MTSKVNTGGMKEFVYKKGHEPKLSLQEEREIDEAYKKVAKRKKKEKIIKWVVITIIILAFGTYFLLK